MVNADSRVNCQGALRAKGCAQFFGIGESTWWRWASEGRIPPGIRLSGRVTVWKISDVIAFMERAADRGGSQ